MEQQILVISTVPDEKTAEKIALHLVEKRLAACVSVSSSVQSFFWWENKISQEKEFILFIKTRLDLYASLESALLEIHPYQVPEIIGIPLAKGFSKYLSWISQETRQ